MAGIDRWLHYTVTTIDRFHCIKNCMRPMYCTLWGSMATKLIGQCRSVMHNNNIRIALVIAKPVQRYHESVLSENLLK